MSLSPLHTFFLQNYTDWLQELREKGAELLKQPPVNTEAPLVRGHKHTLEGLPLALLSPGRDVFRFHQATRETFVLG